MDKPQFAADWPQPCPPSEATPTSGIVYRRSKNNPPSDWDLKSQHERGTGRGAPSCGSCGLSVLTDEADIEHQYNACPWQGRYVLKGILQTEHGRMLPDPSDSCPSHTNIWFHDGIDRKPLFSLHVEIKP